jgi:hypothetical protein
MIVHLCLMKSIASFLLLSFLLMFAVKASNMRSPLSKFSKQTELPTSDTEDSNEENTRVDLEDLFYQATNYGTLTESLIDDSYLKKSFFNHSFEFTSSVCLTILTPPPNN